MKRTILTTALAALLCLPLPAQQPAKKQAAPQQVAQQPVKQVSQTPPADTAYFRAGLWRSQLDAYYKADSARFPAPGALLFVGSSSIRMWHDVAAYFPEYRVLGRGFGGAWMSDVLYHIDRLVIAYRPGQVVLYAGENDMANGVAPETVARDVDCFLRLMELHLPGVPVIVISPKPSPSNARWLENQRRAGALIAEACRTRTNATYVDVATPMLGPGGEFREELYLSDRLHLTAEAYRLWARLITPHLIPQRNEK